MKFSPYSYTGIKYIKYTWRVYEEHLDLLQVVLLNKIYEKNKKNKMKKEWNEKNSRKNFIKWKRVHLCKNGWFWWI